MAWKNTGNSEYHDFQLALDKHREALKDLFKELFHDREIKTEKGGQFCVIFGDFKISLLIETAKFENGVPVKLNSVNPIIVKFKKDKPVAKAQFSDATQYLDSAFQTPHYQYEYTAMPFIFRNKVNTSVFNKPTFRCSSWWVHNTLLILV